MSKRIKPPTDPASPGPIIQEIGRYIRFSSSDLERLRAVAPRIEEHLPQMAALFYETIQRNPRAAQVLREGPEQIPRLQQTLIRWARSLLTEDRDERYGEMRRRVGAKHVELSLENRYVLGAITILRTFLAERVRQALRSGPVLEATLEALHRAIDLDTCLITESYFVDTRTQVVAQKQLVESVTRHVQELLLRGAHNLLNLDAIRAQVSRLIPIDRMVLALERAEDQTLEIVAVSSEVDVKAMQSGARVAQSDTPYNTVFRRGVPRVLSLDARAKEATLRALHAAGFRRIAVVPLWADECVIGTLSFARRDEEPDLEEWLPMLGSIADLLALAVTRWEAARRLAASERQYRSLFEAIGDGICTASNDGRYLLCNPTFAESIGKCAGDVVGHRVHDIFPPAVAAAVEALHGEVLSKGLPMSTQLLMELDGRDRWMSLRYTPIHDATGNVTGLTCVARDVTDERVQAAQQAHQHKMASLGLLASGVAHEVNNPLASIATMAQDLLDGEPSEEDAKILRRILSSTQRVGRSLQQLLRYARPSQGQPDMVSVNEVVERAREVASFDPRARGLPLESRLDPALPWVIGNADQLTQVVLNLLINAFDAMAGKKTPIEVTTRVDGPCVCLCVIDHGPGIPPEHRSRVFEPFYSTKNDTGGTGLGLFVCRRIVREHGGTVTIQDSKGQGATFVVRLPIPGRSPLPAG